MRLIDADRLLSDKMKSKYYHLPNGDVAIPIVDIEHAPTVGDWISVKDRLPEPDTNVLWCAKYEPERVNAIRYCDRKWDIRITAFTGCINKGIPDVESYGDACVPLYWMPMPEPPKEEENAAD